MATRAETRQIRIAQWRKIFEERSRSGLTVREFCARNNLSRDAFFYWQDIVRKDALSDMKQPALIELKPPVSESTLVKSDERLSPGILKPQLAITINNATIQVDSNTPKELLSMVLEVISNAC